MMPRPTTLRSSNDGLLVSYCCISLMGSEMYCLFVHLIVYVGTLLSYLMCCELVNLCSCKIANSCVLLVIIRPIEYI